MQFTDHVRAHITNVVLEYQYIEHYTYQPRTSAGQSQSSSCLQGSEMVIHNLLDGKEIEVSKPGQTEETGDGTGNCSKNTRGRRPKKGMEKNGSF